jgi:hypothetical protein
LLPKYAFLVENTTITLNPMEIKTYQLAVELVKSGYQTNPSVLPTSPVAKHGSFTAQSNTLITVAILFVYYFVIHE